MGKQKFPQYLSRPLQVLWFEADDLCVVLIFFTLALVYGNIAWLLLILAPWLYIKAKNRYPRGFLKHCFYFMGVLTLKKYPIFFEDLFIE